MNPVVLLEGEATAEPFSEQLAHLRHAVEPDASSFLPEVPRSLEDTGLSPALMEQLILKILYARGEVMGRELAKAVGLQFSLIERLLESLKRYRFAEVKGSLGYGAVSSMFALSEAGRARAREYLEENQYGGKAPVPIAQYVKGVRAQRSKNGWLTKSLLAEAYRHMVVSPRILSQIGPAVNSGKSFLIYGQAGNGKTYLAEALFGLKTAPIFVPYAIETQGMIINMYDPVYHRRIEEPEDSLTSFSRESAHDERWFLCRRPFIVTGGELSLSMLDLSFSPSSKIYEAPFQIKANNGIYLIDDFGRQKATPAEVLNRWIVPMDRHVDYLTFPTGGKVEIPFETFLIFSTNLKPQQLGDEAFLRRMQYKMLLRNPSRPEFMEIFQRFCIGQNLDYCEKTLSNFIARHYEKTGKHFRRCQPRDVITHAIDHIHFESLPMELTEDVLDHAFESCFVDTNDGDE